MGCDCRICQEYREFQLKLELVPQDLRAFVEGIYDAYVNTAADRDYYKAIVQNQWPSGDQILSQYRQPKEQD